MLGLDGAGVSESDGASMQLGRASGIKTRVQIANLAIPVAQENRFFGLSFGDSCTVYLTAGTKTVSGNFGYIIQSWGLGVLECEDWVERNALVWSKGIF